MKAAMLSTALRRAALVVSAAVLGVLATTAVTASPAAAAGPCGSAYAHVGHHAVKSSVTGTVGYVDVYWASSANRNCAVLNGTGSTYGFKGYKKIKLWAAGYFSRADTDAGYYSYYAGPVYTPSGVNMTNRCINIEVAMEEPTGWTVNTGFGPFHCG